MHLWAGFSAPFPRAQLYYTSLFHKKPVFPTVFFGYYSYITRAAVFPIAGHFCGNGTFGVQNRGCFIGKI
jgi:hypothetical protein